MNNLLTQQESIRYSRHLNLKEVGAKGQLRLKNSKVLCVGAGGLGSPTLLYLAAAGVGTLGIIDDDVVELSNLQRQILYSENTLHQKKVIAAKAHLTSLNSDITIECIEARLTTHNVLDYLKPYDVIIDGTDNFTTRYLVNDACVSLNKPNVFASIYQFEGQLSIFSANGGPCYRCLFPSSPPNHLVPNCNDGGVMGVLPGIMGTLQANEVVKLILQIGQPLIAKLLCFNALTMQFNQLHIKPDPNCLACGKNKKSFEQLNHQENGACTMKETKPSSITVEELRDLQQKNIDFTILDVREPSEYEICNIGGHLIPLNQLPNRINELDPDKLLIVHCKLGGRSQQAVEFLQRSGFTNVKNLEGGIIAWINKIDPSLPKY